MHRRWKSNAAGGGGEEERMRENGKAQLPRQTLGGKGLAALAKFVYQMGQHQAVAALWVNRGADHAVWRRVGPM